MSHGACPPFPFLGRVVGQLGLCGSLLCARTCRRVGAGSLTAGAGDARCMLQHGSLSKPEYRWASLSCCVGRNSGDPSLLWAPLSQTPSYNIVPTTRDLDPFHLPNTLGGPLRRKPNCPLHEKISISSHTYPKCYFLLPLIFIPEGERISLLFNKYTHNNHS